MSKRITFLTRYPVLARFAPVVIAALMTVGFAAESCGQEQAAKAERRHVNQLLSPGVFKEVSKAREFMEQEDQRQAQALLTELLKNKRLSDFEEASVYQMLTFFFISNENYPAAIHSTEAALALQALDSAIEQDLRYNLVQLYSLQEQYGEAIQQLKNWFALAENPSAQAYFMAAQLYGGMEDFTHALAYAEQGMQKHRLDPEPREAWYRLLLAIRLQVLSSQATALQPDNLESTTALLQEMLGHWPATLSYYQQLSALYQEQQQPTAALGVLAIAQQNGLMVGKDLRRLLDLYRINNNPYQGARLLQSAIEEQNIEADAKDWEALANAWMQAREWQRAETALQRSARLSPTGENWLRLCQTAVQDERWPDARERCENALAAGGLRQSEQAWQLLGMAHFYEDNFVAAAEAFSRCVAAAEAGHSCGQWLEVARARNAPVD